MAKPGFAAHGSPKLTRDFRTHLVLLLVLAAAWGLAACGPQGDSASNSPDAPAESNEEALADVSLPPTLITNRDVAEQKKDSSAAALLEWWRAFQFRDEGGVLELTTDETVSDVGEANIDELVDVLGPNIHGVEIEDVRETDDSAVVRTLLLEYATDKQGDVIEGSTSGTPQSFAMTRDDGVWKFDESDYLQTLRENVGLTSPQADEG
jgi:hypothetical protein